MQDSCFYKRYISYDIGKDLKQTQNCLLPMGVTSENVAHCFTVSRQEQDQAAVDSHRKAVVAAAAGRIKDEIIPVATKVLESREAKDGEIGALCVMKEVDHIPDDTKYAESIKQLAQVLPSFIEAKGS